MLLGQPRKLQLRSHAWPQSLRHGLLGSSVSPCRELDDDGTEARSGMARFLPAGLGSPRTHAPHPSHRTRAAIASTRHVSVGNWPSPGSKGLRAMVISARGSRPPRLFGARGTDCLLHHESSVVLGGRIRLYSECGDPAIPERSWSGPGRPPLNCRCPTSGSLSRKTTSRRR